MKKVKNYLNISEKEIKKLFLFIYNFKYIFSLSKLID